MHGLCQFTILKVHIYIYIYIYIYVEDSSISVVVPSSLATDSQLSFKTLGIANLAIQCKNPEDKIPNTNATGISNHTQNLLSGNATKLTMTFMATLSIVP
jgi:hypothetical protein